MADKFLFITSLVFYVMLSGVCHANNAIANNSIDTTHSTKGSKAKARTVLSVHCNNFDEVVLVHISGRAQFSYYIYDDAGFPVMSGAGEFDADGLFNVAIDTLPSGHYTVEVVINGSANLCSFFKM